MSAASSSSSWGATSSSSGRLRQGLDALAHVGCGAAGAPIQQNLKVQKAPDPGNLLGVVHIRYVDADEVPATGQ
jgi:hypothetical protein